MRKKCGKSMKRWRKEGCVSRLCLKSRATVADDLDDEMQILQAGEEGRGSCASQSNGSCFDPAMVEQVFACGAAHTEHFIQAIQEEFNRRFKSPAAPEQMAGGEEEREKIGKETGINGGGFGGGNPSSTPRNGLHARDSSRSPRGQRNKMEEDAHL